MPRLSMLLALACGLAFGQRQGSVSGRVVDAETGNVIPCTVAIRTADGRIVTDHPSFRDGFRSAGTFEKELPAGRTSVMVSRGFDYGAQEQAFVLGGGEHRKLEFALRRRTPLRREGWYCGDSHVHMIHGERTIVVDFADVALAARAEALDYTSLAQHWNLSDVTPEALQQACERVSTRDFQLLWNVEAPKNYWRGDSGRCAGHGWTLGMSGRAKDGRDAIHELLEMSAWDYESEKPPTPNFEIQAFIHSLGGIVSYTHPHRWWWGKWGGKGGYPVEERKAISNMAAELPFDTVIGPTYDTLDIMMQPGERDTNRDALALWFLLLNHGYRIPATTGSDTTFDNPGGGVPGKVRVYTRVDGAPTPAAIAKAMKAGRNFVTSGPLVTLEIDGKIPGGVIRPGAAKRDATIRAWPGPLPGEELGKVELIRNGVVIRTFEPHSGTREFKGIEEISETESAWYIARAYGPAPERVAVTNPVYFEAPGYHPPPPAAAHVTAIVRDSDTGAPIDGICEVVRMDGRKPVKESQSGFKAGRFEMTVPATVRLRVRAPGYRPEMKSVYMDHAPLLDVALNMTGQKLSDWNTFEQLRQHLGNVRLDFSLHRE